MTKKYQYFSSAKQNNEKLWIKISNKVQLAKSSFGGVIVFCLKMNTLEFKGVIYGLCSFFFSHEFVSLDFGEITLFQYVLVMYDQFISY